MLRICCAESVLIMARRRSFGRIRQGRSKRWEAAYIGPDNALHHAPATFVAKIDAEAWLAEERRLISVGAWTPPEHRGALTINVTLAAYAEPWLADRTLKPRTREHYQFLLDRMILPGLGDKPLKGLTPVTIRAWHAELGAKTPTLRAHAYGLLRTILTTAVHDGLIPSNPAHIRGAGNSKRVHKIKPLTLPELEALVAAMPERLRLLVLLAAWCGLRFGELTELRRSDLDLKNGRIKIRRAVVHVNGKAIVGTPKSDAGIRDVAIPPHLLPTVKAHIAEHAQFGRDGLLFPAKDGGHLVPSSLYGRAPTRTRGGWGFYAARDGAKRPDLRFHDLRHTGAVLAAATGATLAELMARLGHSTQGAALRYQHAAQDRDLEIARRLSAMVEVKPD
jgi:integrase